MFKPVLILSLLFACGMVSAADALTDAMQKAYVPYRVVLNKTNNKLQDEARQAIAQVQQSWNQVAAQYGAKPPAPYDRDPAIGSSMAEVTQVYVKAAEEIEKNQLIEAHETLERARQVMAEMRHRNNVIVYSDHAMAYLAQRDLILNDGSRTLSEPDGLLKLSAQVGVLDYMAAKLKSEAPAEYGNNETFFTMIKAVDKSVTDLKAALLSQDAEKIKEAINAIKLPYGRLFITFG